MNFAQEWAAQNKVEMQITLVLWKEFMTKISAAIQVQATPDIVESGGVELRALGQLLDVTDIYEKLEKEQGGCLGAAPLYMRELDGRVHHILYGLAGAVDVARKDLLSQAGFQKPPETWEELLAQAKKAQQIPRVYGLAQPTSNQTDSNIWEQVMRSYGARLADEQGKKVVLGDHKREVWAFLDYFMEAWNAGVLPPGVTTWDNTMNNSTYQAGKAVFALNVITIALWVALPKSGGSPLLTRLQGGSRAGAPAVGGGLPVPLLRWQGGAQCHHGHVSSPRHGKRRGRFSRTPLACALHATGEGTSHAGRACGPRRGRWTRSSLHRPRWESRHGLRHLCQPTPRRCRARLRCRRTVCATPSCTPPHPRRASPPAPERPAPPRRGGRRGITRSMGWDCDRRHRSCSGRPSAVRCVSLGRSHARPAPGRLRPHRPSTPPQRQVSPWATAPPRRCSALMGPWSGARAARRRVATALRSPSCCGEAATKSRDLG